MKRIPAKSRTILAVLGFVASAVLWPFLVVLCFVAGFKRKTIDVGLGPHPLINNVYHKRALERFGYSAQTFVTKTYHITDQFDLNLERLSLLRPFPVSLRRAIACLIGFVHVVWSYRALYIYFNGGPLSVVPGFLGRCEPMFYRLAGVRVVVMPYGGDVQDLSRSPNLYFKHTMTLSYPNFRLVRDKVVSDIDMWTAKADHIISGVEWVDYMYHWDTLMLAHFSIDTQELRTRSETEPYVRGVRPLRLLHAPNHRAIKGTDAFIEAVDDLRQEGFDIELTLIEKRPNHEVLEAIANSDLILDQLVVGWYAMFAIEAMALGKPVLCYTRPDLIDLYLKAGLLEDGEIPFLSADVATVRSLLREVAKGNHDLTALGHQSRTYVETHHSLEAVGAVFDRINRAIGVAPSGTASAIAVTDVASDSVS